MRLVIGFLALLLLANCGGAPCGCPFGTICVPDSSKLENFRCEPAPRNSDETAVTIPRGAA